MHVFDSFETTYVKQNTGFFQNIFSVEFVKYVLKYYQVEWFCRFMTIQNFLS